MLVAICLLFTIHTWMRASIPRSDDFLHYWTTARYLRVNGPANVYNKQIEQIVFDWKQDISEVADQQYEIVHTPLLYAAVDLISTGAIETDFKRFHAISLLSYAFMIIMMLHWFNYSLMSGMFLYIVLFIFNPSLMDSFTSNLTRFQLGVLAVAIAFIAPTVKHSKIKFIRSRALCGHLASGLLFGFLVALKPNIMFIPFFLALSRAVRRQWQIITVEAAGGIIGGIVGLIAGATLFSSIFCWRDWAERMSRFPQGLFTIEEGNFSFPNLLKGITSNDVLISVVTVIGFIAVLMRIVWLSRKFVLLEQGYDRKESNDGELFDLQIVASGCFAWLLYMNLVWSFYYLFSVPMIVLLFSKAWRQNNGIRGAIAAVVAICSMHLPMLLNAPSLVSAWLMWSGAFVLFVLGTSSPVATKIITPN